MFFRKEDQFSIHLKTISENLVESTHHFYNYKNEKNIDVKTFAEEMKVYENKGDTYVHQVIHDLNKVFITPIEREDILALATHMDDVLDGLEGTAALFEVFAIPTVDEYMLQFVDYIKKCVDEIDKAIDLLAEKKLLEMREHIIKIKDYESKCDEVRRVSIKNLFERETDPITIIKYKEIYEELEDVSDYCEAVANTLDAVIMKNA